MTFSGFGGRPWASDGFRASWGKACERAGLAGHALKDVEAVVDARHPGRHVPRGKAAVLNPQT